MLQAHKPIIALHPRAERAEDAARSLAPSRAEFPAAVAKRVCVFRSVVPIYDFAIDACNRNVVGFYVGENILLCPKAHRRTSWMIPVKSVAPDLSQAVCRNKLSSVIVA